MAARKQPTPDILGILPLQDAVLFPNTVIPLAVVKRPGILLVEEALREGKQIGLVVLKDKDIEDPGPDDLRRVGTIGTIQKMLKVPDGTLPCNAISPRCFNGCSAICRKRRARWRWKSTTSPIRIC
jgi:ATP-dependent Lon protease